MPIASSQGTSISFGGTVFDATDIKVKQKGAGYDDKVEVTTLADTARVYDDPVLLDSLKYMTEVSCSFLGSTAPTTGTELTLSITGLPGSGMAICTECEVTAQVGEKIKGTATFQISPY
jgi:hypothetical protein